MVTFYLTNPTIRALYLTSGTFYLKSMTVISNCNFISHSVTL